MSDNRFLIVSHAHPDFSVGGAEIAAYNLFLALRHLRPDAMVHFLARSDLPSSPPGSISVRRPDEFLWRQDMGSWFALRSGVPASVSGTFRHFLQETRPDVVFVQHFAHIGVEVLREIRRTLPRARIVLTLHEFVAICNRNGQMLKTVDNKLCYEESPQDCHRCFPQINVEEFWLRKHFIQKHFEAVDHFVSPSRFLAERFIDWGLPRDAVSVIENGQATWQRRDLRARMGSRTVTFGFFGQITEYKGLDVLLKAIQMIPDEIRAKAVFEVHGANLEQQGQWLRDLIETLREPLLREGSLRWAGPYGRENVLGRMSRVDWVIVPSIWWENSPMVIQEAFVAGRPVICSGIGGMAEKVRDGIDGLHFEVSNSFDLAEKLIAAIEDPSIAERLAAAVPEPPSYDAAALHYLSLAETARPAMALDTVSFG